MFLLHWTVDGVLCCEKSADLVCDFACVFDGWVVVVEANRFTGFVVGNVGVDLCGSVFDGSPLRGCRRWGLELGSSCAGLIKT
jgi:hypothetical protein